MKIGVLGYQGDVEEHISTINSISKPDRNVRGMRVTKRSEIDACDGLIIPGGESTTIYKLILEYGLYDYIKEKAVDGFPVMGTCAGLIILAAETGDDRVRGMGAVDVSIRRNAYGRQINSFIKEINIKGIGSFPAVFIRAPVIDSAGTADVLSYDDEKPVMVRRGNVIGMTFHPELTGKTNIHEYFLHIIEGERSTSTGDLSR
ncbi:pyridoxal 5'-phosphate synthase glutaminase subunit PdxT [Oxyplasma meridianum]|uniref:Pyridoxal 5'-phosphate synthase subunit PdxT n=1 Tax=Oxyplasma meridianum TaxID=3073602 RepID=A0AAX4NIX9_9ARCH